jgi:sugar lactone lactonase YvrE
MKTIAWLLPLVLGCGDNAKGVTQPDGRDTSKDSGSDVFDTLLAFSAAMGQLPEGVVAVNNVPFVGFAPAGLVVRVVEHDTLMAHGNLPAPVADTFTLGLAANTTGEIFVGVGASGANPTPAPGIYKIPAAGGQATLFASNNAMKFPNGLDFDDVKLYATDSAAGRVFDISASGQVGTWSMNALLAGDQTACGGSGAGFDIGANGIVHDANFRYVAVSDFGRIVKIPKLANGNAGTPVVVAESCADLAGIDGIALDADGSIIGVRNGPSNTMVRVAADGTITKLHVGAPLDGPASVTIDTKGAVRRLLITNSAFFSGATGKPALLAFPL